jgi:hypothetical protein
MFHRSIVQFTSKGVPSALSFAIGNIPLITQPLVSSPIASPKLSFGIF